MLHAAEAIRLELMTPNDWEDWDEPYLQYDWINASLLA